MSPMLQSSQLSGCTARSCSVSVPPVRAVRTCAVHRAGAAVPSREAIQEEQAAFNASIERVVRATSAAGAGAELIVEDSYEQIGRLALLHSSQRKFSRTHTSTVNMSSEEEESTEHWTAQLPLSQLAFKALLRASLAAARLNHSSLTTPHILLGLLSAAAASTNSSLAAAADRCAEAEAAVTAMIDGPNAAVSPAAAAASLLGQRQGLDVVTWCGDLSVRAQQVLRAAEQLRQQQGCTLLTSRHLLTALLQEAASSPKPWVNSLLLQLGLNPEWVSAQLEAQGSVAEGEDGVLCEPVGFLHEEIYNSLLRSVSPASPVTSCLN